VDENIKKTKFPLWDFANKGKLERRISYGIIFLVIITPVLLLTFFSFQNLHRLITENAFEKREAISNLAAITLEEQFDRLEDVAMSLATRVRFRELIEQGDWEGAVKIMDDVPRDFLSIERVFLADPDGILRSDTPHLSGVVGVDFSFRDWYKGVSQNWELYISAVYKRTAEPRYNLIAIAIPIKDDQEEVLGILVLQVRLETLYSWTQLVDIGSAASLYVVDHSGNLAAHPHYLSQDPIVNLSDDLYVQKVLNNKSGIEVSDEKDVVVSYAPIEKYGWGVLIEESTATFFAGRDSLIKTALITYGFFIVLAIGVSLFIIYSFKAVGASRNREEIYLESVGDGIVAIDLKWRIILWNKAASQITGFTKKEAIGKPFRDIMKFVFENSRKENIRFIEDAIVFGESQNMKNHTVLVKKDGSEIPIGDSASPVINAAGDVEGAIIVFRDLSEEKKVELLRSDFSYASHQIRTPVTKALWSLETVLEKDDIEEVKNWVKISYDAVKSIQRLSEEIVKVSQIDQGTVFPENKKFSVEKLVSEIVASLKEKAELKKVQIALNPIKKSLTLNSDPGLLKEAILEVINNAIDYSESGGKVNINVKSKDEGVLIKVHDDGIGISESEHTFMFNKFFRGSNFDKTDIEGAGLGLYITKIYIKLLGGKIWFESGDKKGTTFSIYVPNHK